MNEKIRELTKQAGLYEHDGMVFGSTSGYEGISIEEVEKFAELIVRECIEVMHATISESMDLGRCAVETAEWIEADTKRHFGVEP